MKSVLKASSWSLTKIPVVLLVILIAFPAIGFGESKITIKIGPELQSQLTSDGLPALRTYLPDAANPRQRCTHLGNNQSADSVVYFPGEDMLSLYTFLASPGSDAERILCAIANDPSNTSLVDEGDWALIFDDLSNPLSIAFTGGTNPVTVLALIVGNTTSNYTFIGPLAVNDAPPCCPTVPAFNHWGVVMFAILLIGSSLWLARRRRMT